MAVKPRLLAELQRAADGTSPCMTSDSHLWVSENWRERRTAARLCVGCPVFNDCRLAAEAEPVEVWGVWAGREYFDVTAGREPSQPVLSELDGARLRRLGESARSSSPKSVKRGELAEELARLRRLGYGTATLAGATGWSRPAISAASTRGHRTAQTRAKLPDQDPDAARLAVLREQANRSDRAWHGADPTLVGERNRLLRRLRQRNPGMWSWSRLGELAGLSAPGVGKVLRGGPAVKAPRPDRAAVIGMEVEARASRDPRVRRLLELRALLANTSGRAHRAERAERARLVVELWWEDATFWTGGHLAVAGGTSAAWVSIVVRAALSSQARQPAAG